MKKLFILLFTFFIFFIDLIKPQLTPASPDINISELLYNNNTLNFVSYPKSTSNFKCLQYIPFHFVSNNGPILNLSPTGDFITTYSSTDQKEILILLQNENGISLNPNSIIKSFQVNSIPYSFNFSLHCKGYDISNLKYKILNSGIVYNSLSFQIQFNQYLSDSLIIDFEIKTTNKQKYIGNNIYSISFDNNNLSFFSTDSNNNILLNIIFYNNQKYPILIPNPYKNSLINPSQKYYQNINSDSSFLELSNLNTLNNYFSTDSSTSLFLEPFLINSNNNNNFTYLTALGTDILNTTNYIITSHSNQLIFDKILNQKNIQLDVLPLNLQFSFGFDFIEVSVALNESFLNYPYNIELGYELSLFKYPFGLKGNYSNSIISFPVKLEYPRGYSPIVLFLFNGYNKQFNVGTNKEKDILNQPVLNNYSISLLPNGKMITTFNVSNVNFLESIFIYLSDNLAYKSFPMNEINSNFNSTISILIPRMNIYKIVLKSNDSTINNYYVNSFYRYKSNNQIFNLQSIQELDVLPSNFNFLNGIQMIRFLKNDLKVTNTRVSNKMFIKLDSNFPKTREIMVTFVYSEYNGNIKNNTIYSIFNNLSGEYEFEFNVPMNIKPGYVNYIISLDSINTINYYSYSLDSQYQLNILESNNIDLFGPICTQLKIISNPLKISLNFEIQDLSNGFNYGYIIIRGSNDLTERNLTIDQSNLYAGTIYSGVYSIDFNYDSQCIVQVYSMVYAYFQDNEGYFTEYDVTKVNKKNPFYKILDTFNPNATSICQPLNTLTGYQLNPDLISLDFPSNVVLGITELSRTVSFNYTTYHPDGISLFSLPKVYLATFSEKYYISSKTIVQSSNQTHTTFSSIIILPFIGPLDSKVSIFGIVSKAGTIGSVLPSQLLLKVINSNFTTSNSYIGPIITESSRLSNTGLGGLWIYGNYLNTATGFKIQYTDDNNGYISINAQISNSVSVYFSNIRKTNKPINIIATLDQINGEPFTIYPEIFSYDTSNNGNNPTSQCKGSPLCGGSTHGTCLSSGCKCISPWTGDDCMSKVIQVPPPIINQTNPETNITTDGGDITFKSIISVVGIKELDIDSNTINEYYFDKWIYKLLLNDSYVQKYYYQSTIEKNKIQVSNITVTLDWFKVESSIQFANEQIDIHPSTIKYTIGISSYPFSNQLNTLQLIMKASLQSSNNEACSSKQFGDSIQNNSNYIQLQVDDHSFYGRFIKRCIIDNNKIASLSNTLLNSLNNNTIKNDDKTSESFIGINIPQFTESVLIDPDFSLILNSYSPSCNGGLSKSQLAGIIIGSVCFFIIVIIIVSILIYKSPGCLPVKIFFYKLFKKSKI